MSFRGRIQGRQWKRQRYSRNVLHVQVSMHHIIGDVQLDQKEFAVLRDSDHELNIGFVGLMCCCIIFEIASLQGNDDLWLVIERFFTAPFK